MDQTADSSLDKVSWDEVIKMGEQVSKQATLGISFFASLLHFFNVNCITCYCFFSIFSPLAELLCFVILFALLLGLVVV